jgi:sulfatase modifying factor 1
VAECKARRDCPAGYECVPKPQTTISVCCRTERCGFPAESPDAAAQLDAPPRPDARPDLGADQAQADLPVDLPPALADASDGPAVDAADDGPGPLAPDAAPDLAPDAGPDAGPPCPASKGGPALVRSGSFCIDSTEVTNQQYMAFLTAKAGDVSGQPASCKWNTSYTPSTDDVAWPYLPGRDNHPVGSVDWCDSYMFCSWAGKRLCGKVGGGRITPVEAANELTGQWMYACSGGGRVAYPYSTMFSRTTCNTDAPTSAAMYVEEVKHRPRCEGGFTGLYDMSGNMEEWIDACDKDTGAADKCGIAGSTSYTGDLTPSDLTCSGSIFGEARNTQYYLLGFRCCAP